MKLIKFLQSIKEATDKRKLLSMFLITIDKKVTKIGFDYISDKFGISNRQIQIFIKEFPELTIEKYVVKFETAGTDILVKRAKEKTAVELTTEKKAFIEKVLETLNEITGKRFRYSAKKSRTCILARIDEGYIFDEFVHVIHGQSIRWLGTESELYLRPETLFGTKMEGYVNAPIPASNPNQNKLQKINEAINQAKQFDWENNS